MMREAYFVSGLGADKRLFNKQIKDGIPLKIIEWKKPHANESIESYAKRMADEIPKDRPVTIGGVSFGGMMAMEMSKYVQAEKIILISSVKSYKEIPLRIKIWKYFPVYKLVTGRLIKRIGILLRYVFGKMSSGESSAFEEMVIDSDEHFLTWGIQQIVNWNKEYNNKNVVHIHGTKDLIFPIHLIKDPVTKIKYGTRIMILTMADRINELLKNELAR